MRVGNDSAFGGELLRRAGPVSVRQQSDMAIADMTARRNHSRLGVAVWLAFIFALILVPAPVADADTNCVEVVDSFSSSHSEAGTDFHVTQITVPYTSGPVTLARDCGGTQPINVNDGIVVEFTRPDGSTSSFSHDFSNGCSGTITSAGPFDLASNLAPGENTLKFRLRDLCGQGGSSTSDLMLIFEACPIEGVQPTIQVTQPNQSTQGTAGDDVICGTAGDDAINGLGGNDTIFGLGGQDTLEGGADADHLFGGDEVVGGDHRILGGRGDDTIDAGAGNDGSAVGDLAFGGVAGGEGNDTISGGAGNDLLFGSCAADVLGDPLFFCPTDPPVAGAPDRDTILGEGGEDLILGEGDRDTLSGGDENDTIDGGDGGDEIDGGPGDEVDFLFELGAFSGLTGGRGNDIILGGDGDDFIAGEADNDRIFGDLGSDKLKGNADRDCLVGGPRKDVFAGGPDNDKLKSRDGVHDVVHGNGGNNDRARVDQHDDVDHVEDLSPPSFDCAP
jgi:hemolysin type calcium-binding protein